MEIHRTATLKHILLLLSLVLATAAFPAVVVKPEDSLPSSEQKDLLIKHHQANNFEVHTILQLPNDSSFFSFGRTPITLLKKLG